MKKITVLVVAALFGMSLLGICFAEEKLPEITQEKPKEAAQEKPSEPRKTSLYRGVVGKVKLKAKTIEVMKENMDIGLVFDASQAKFNGYKKLKDIKVKDRVTVEYDIKIGKNIALVITKEK